MILSVSVQNLIVTYQIYLSKKVYFYEYMSDFENFKEQLPCKEKFYSSLLGKKISDKEYEHLVKVWNKFEMKTVKYYQDQYLKQHAFLLGDVFEKVRNNSLKNYGLCPSHYLSSPDLIELGCNV